MAEYTHLEVRDKRCCGQFGLSASPAQDETLAILALPLEDAQHVDRKHHGCEGDLASTSINQLMARLGLQASDSRAVGLWRTA